jgi:hypothetical protein
VAHSNALNSVGTIHGGTIQPNQVNKLIGREVKKGAVQSYEANNINKINLTEMAKQD